MNSNDDFQELIQRVRGGDEEAVHDLWRDYQPLLQREIRLRLHDPRLRRRLDESDICQSVMASFFARVQVGQFELENADQLRHLLAQMARNKLASQVRRHGAERRDYRRAGELPESSRFELRNHVTASPSHIVTWKELLQRFRAQLNDEERKMAELRADGKSWAQIAAFLGGTPDGRRLQFSRAIKRVSEELGLDDDGEL